MAGKKNNKPGKKVISLEREGQENEKSKKPKAPRKAFRYPGRGRPREYTDAEALARGCEKYFASISRVDTVRDLLGNASTNSLGREVEQVVWLMQPSMGGLARSLGISDRTLRNYEDDDDLKPVVEWAKGICRDWLLEQVTTREKGSLNGLIFVLENNYGMKEQVAVEHSGERIEEYLARLEAGAEGKTEF